MRKHVSSRSAPLSRKKIPVHNRPHHISRSIRPRHPISKISPFATSHRTTSCRFTANAPSNQPDDDNFFFPVSTPDPGAAKKNDPHRGSQMKFAHDTVKHLMSVHPEQLGLSRRQQLDMTSQLLEQIQDQNEMNHRIDEMDDMAGQTTELSLEDQRAAQLKGFDDMDVAEFLTRADMGEGKATLARLQTLDNVRSSYARMTDKLEQRQSDQASLPPPTHDDTVELDEELVHPSMREDPTMYKYIDDDYEYFIPPNTSVQKLIDMQLPPEHIINYARHQAANGMNPSSYVGVDWRQLNTIIQLENLKRHEQGKEPILFSPIELQSLDSVDTAGLPADDAADLKEYFAQIQKTRQLHKLKRLKDSSAFDPDDPDWQEDEDQDQREERLKQKAESKMQEQLAKYGASPPSLATAENFDHVDTIPLDPSPLSRETQFPEHRQTYKAMKSFSRTVPMDQPLPEELRRRLNLILTDAGYLKAKDFHFMVNDVETWYLANRMPVVYSVLRRILIEIRQRIPTWKPESVLEFAAGASPAFWAARDIYYQDLAEYTAIERDGRLALLGQQLTADLGVHMYYRGRLLVADDGKPQLNADDEKRREKKRAKLSAKQRKIMDKEDKQRHSIQQERLLKKHALVVAPYALSKQPNKEYRRLLLESLWDQVDPAGGLLLLVESTEADSSGFNVIRECRDYLLKKYPKNASVDLKITPLAHVEERIVKDGDSSVPSWAQDATNKVADQQAAEPSASSILPCSHDRPCPMGALLKLNDQIKKLKKLSREEQMSVALPQVPIKSCMFGQRMLRAPMPNQSPLQNLDIPSHLGDAIIENFSYIVLRRGNIPIVHEDAFTPESAQPEDLSVSELQATEQQMLMEEEMEDVDARHFAMNIFGANSVDNEETVDLHSERIAQKLSLAHLGKDDQKSEKSHDSIYALANAAADDEMSRQIKELFEQDPVFKDYDIDVIQQELGYKLDFESINTLRDVILGMDTEQSLINPKREFNINRWSRVLSPPLKRGGHVVMDLCTPDGNFERRVVGKAGVGGQGFKQARHIKWGDVWPYKRPMTLTELKEQAKELQAATQTHSLNSIASSKDASDKLKELRNLFNSLYDMNSLQGLDKFNSVINGPVDLSGLDGQDPLGEEQHLHAKDLTDQLLDVMNKNTQSGTTQPEKQPALPTSISKGIQVDDVIHGVEDRIQEIQKVKQQRIKLTKKQRQIMEKQESPSPAAAADMPASQSFQDDLLQLVLDNDQLKPRELNENENNVKINYDDDGDNVVRDDDGGGDEQQAPVEENLDVVNTNVRDAWQTTLHGDSQEKQFAMRQQLLAVLTNEKTDVMQHLVDQHTRSTLNSHPKTRKLASEYFFSDDENFDIQRKAAPSNDNNKPASANAANARNTAKSIQGAAVDVVDPSYRVLSTKQKERMSVSFTGKRSFEAGDDDVPADEEPQYIDASVKKRNSSKPAINSFRGGKPQKKNSRRIHTIPSFFMSSSARQPSKRIQSMSILGMPLNTNTTSSSKIVQSKPKNKLNPNAQPQFAETPHHTNMPSDFVFKYDGTMGPLSTFAIQKSQEMAERVKEMAKSESAIPTLKKMQMEGNLHIEKIEKPSKSGPLPGFLHQTPHARNLEDVWSQLQQEGSQVADFETYARDMFVVSGDNAAKRYDQFGLEVKGQVGVDTSVNDQVTNQFRQNDSEYRRKLQAREKRNQMQSRIEAGRKKVAAAQGVPHKPRTDVAKTMGKIPEQYDPSMLDSPMHPLLEKDALGNSPYDQIDQVKKLRRERQRKMLTPLALADDLPRDPEGKVMGSIKLKASSHAKTSSQKRASLSVIEEDDEAAVRHLRESQGLDYSHTALLTNQDGFGPKMDPVTGQFMQPPVISPFQNDMATLSELEHVRDYAADTEREELDFIAQKAKSLITSGQTSASMPFRIKLEKHETNNNQKSNPMLPVSKSKKTSFKYDIEPIRQQDLALFHAESTPQTPDVRKDVEKLLLKHKHGLVLSQRQDIIEQDAQQQVKISLATTQLSALARRFTQLAKEKEDRDLLMGSDADENSFQPPAVPTMSDAWNVKNRTPERNTLTTLAINEFDRKQRKYDRLLAEMQEVQMLEQLNGGALKIPESIKNTELNKSFAERAEAERKKRSVKTSAEIELDELKEVLEFERGMQEAVEINYGEAKRQLKRKLIALAHEDGINPLSFEKGVQKGLLSKKSPEEATLEISANPREAEVLAIK